LKQRILLVGPVPPPFGGIASLLEEILQSKLAEVYQLDVFPRNEWAACVARNPLVKNVQRFRRLIRFVRRLGSGHYDLVHLHSADPIFAGSVVFTILARMMRVPVLLHLQGTDWDDFYENVSRGQKALIYCGMRIPQRIIVLYRQWAVNIRRLFPKADLRVVPNRIRPHTKPDQSLVEGIRSRLGLGKDHLVCLSLGSVGWRKGSFDILDAVPQVVRHADYVRFVLVGGEEKPGEMERLRNQVNALGIGRWVILTGAVERERSFAYVSLADLFLLPSYIEGMPIAILEAMQAGKPVIATPVGGIPDTIDNGISGLLVAPGAPSEIATAVLKLLQDSSLRNSMGLAARKAFQERFDFDQGLEDLQAAYTMP
jgi:glycosyltransferase involved in cell wall biosynthesis